MEVKRAALVILSAFTIASLGVPAWAVSINYDYSLDGDGVLSTTNASAIVETFDAPPIWSWTGSGEVVSGSLSGKYAAPYNSGLMSAPDSTRYLSAPDPDGASSGEYTADLGGTYNYLGLFWGSIDSYNTINFFLDGGLVASYTGSDVINPNVANGNQSAPSTNVYVNFWDLPNFDSVQLASTQFAFEADNLAVGFSPVPEPGTMLLLGTGLVGLAGYGRKRHSG